MSKPIGRFFQVFTEYMNFINVDFFKTTAELSNFALVQLIIILFDFQESQNFSFKTSDLLKSPGFDSSSKVLDTETGKIVIFFPNKIKLYNKHILFLQKL